MPGTLDGKTVTAIAAGDYHNLAIVAPVPPEVTGIAPATGPRAGGTSVIITGTDLTGATQVTFGSAGPATSYTVDSSTQITATSPTAGAVGRRHIRVTTPEGTSPTTPEDVYTYTGTKPAITDITPATGPRTGGTTVVITGTDLDDATRVVFGSAGPATSYTIDSPTQITATSPTAGAVGRRHIRVTTPAGTSPTVPSDVFKYTDTKPAITHIAPATGPRAGGTTVVITGTDFTDATRVVFGSVGPATGYTIDSPTQITAIAPAAGAGGRRHLRITTPAGTSPTTPTDAYHYD